MAIVVAVCGPGAAHGQDCWFPEALFPRSAQIATGTFAVQGGAEWARGYVPPFRAAARDRGSAGVDGVVRIAPFEVRARWDWLVDTAPAGTISGPGDVHLGTVATVWRPGAFDVTLGWEAKLPNAADEGELGTDETDVRFGASAGYTRGAFAARAALGLGVLGNPLRFANQDDVPLVRAQASWSRGALAVIGRAAVDVPTARNPARAGADLAVRWGASWYVLARGGGGFVPAEADWRAAVAVGYAGALPSRRPGA